MPESGGLPRRSQSHEAAPTRLSRGGRSLPDRATHQRQPAAERRLGQAQPSGMADSPTNPISSDARDAKRQRLTLWQAVFGQGKRGANRRSALQQARRKEVKASGSNPPLNFFQRSQHQERSRTSEQTASRIAEAKVRQAVLGRSQQFHQASPAANKPTPKQQGLLKARQDDRHRSSQAIPAFQSLLQTDRRNQTALPGLRRETHDRTRRSASKRLAGSGFAGFLRGGTQATDSKTRSTSTPTRDTPRSRSYAAGIYAARMLILSVGIGVLVGTLLSMLDPASRSSAGASQQATKKPDVAETTKASQATASQGGSPVESASATQLPKLGQELTALKAALQTLTLQTPQLTPGMFLFDLDTGAYLDLNGGASFAAASTIKVPILIAFFQDVDAGKIRLDELLTIRKELVAGGSGEMQGLPIGTQFTTLETVTKMITISDNTATNMVIARLGGMAALDQRFRSWGLVSTTINSVLPDLNGTNTTSPKDMALLMTRISQGELVSMRSRDRLLDIMQRTVNHSQLPQGLGKGATIAHKTGDIGSMIGDVGLIDMPNGKRYALTVLVKRSFNDDQAYDLVQKASRTVYQFLSRVPATQNDSATNPAAPARQASPGANGDVPIANSPVLPADTAVTQSPAVDTATR